MSRRYTKKTKRSRRKSPEELKGRIVSVDQGSVQLSLPIAEIVAGLSDTVEALAAQAGMLVMQALIEDEVEQHTAARYAHQADRRASRWGHEEGYVVFAGRKVACTRPRVRTLTGQEVPLERYQMFQSDGRLQQSVRQRVVRRVSMRNYEGVLEDVCDGYGIRKSSVSRHWKAASTRQLQELLERRLDELDLAAVMIDGIGFHEYLLVVALGITSDGRKQVLGLWQGATENAEVCRSLLQDLIDRGLDSQRKFLFVLDGSKALKKAVRSFFGQKNPVQRCQVHKERNVVSHLPERYHSWVRAKLRRAWKMKGYEEAKAELTKLVKELAELNESAAASLQEGLEETLMLHRLGVPEALRGTLRSTNPIESCFSTTRDLCRNVKHWKTADMARRWAGTMLWEAEKRFRRIKGYRLLPVLVQALQQNMDTQDMVA